MNRRWKGILPALLLASVLFLPGCGTKDKAPEPPQDRYGIVDLETLVKAHPRYSEYFRLETEYKGLLAKYKAEQQRLMHLSAARQKLGEAASGDAAEKAAEEEYKARVKIKEDSLNQQLRNLYNEIQSRHQAGGTQPAWQGDTSSDTGTRIANLQLQLKVLGLSGDSRAKAEQELQSLLSSRFAVGKEAGWTAEEKQQMMDKRKASEAELEAYAAQVASEIRQKQQQRQQALAASDLPDPSVWNQEWENRLKQKQKEMADVKADIMQDIRDKAAIIGQEKQLTMIFSSYRANVKALDVTGEIVGELVQIKETKK